MAYEFDLAIVGGGAAGLLAAEIAPQIGLKAALIERSRLGGDCLWTGCVPSKALLASAKAAHTIRHADRYGLPPTDLQLDTAKVWQRIRELQESIATTDDDPERYRRLGVDVVFGEATLADEHTTLAEFSEHMIDRHAHVASRALDEDLGDVWVTQVREGMRLKLKPAKR